MNQLERSLIHLTAATTMPMPTTRINTMVDTTTGSNRATKMSTIKTTGMIRAVHHKVSSNIMATMDVQDAVAMTLRRILRPLATSP